MIEINRQQVDSNIVRPILKIPKGEEDQVRQQYLIERGLANQLKTASKEARRGLYSKVYDELFNRVTWHPQLINKVTSREKDAKVSDRMVLLSRFLKKYQNFLEVGPGDCATSLKVSSIADQVYAADVSREIVENIVFPVNMHFVLIDGLNFNLEKRSIDVAYSYQLMEHLHPEDAAEQLKNIYHLLTNDGIYICNTPNRLSGPHDISKYFEETSNGLHLKEYTLTELYWIFKEVGFDQIYFVKKIKGLIFMLRLNKFTIHFVKFVEWLLLLLPYRTRRRMAQSSLIFGDMTIMGRRRTD
jgi:SAM-dependent methyltransferase